MIKMALISDTAKLPTRKHDSDAGIDLYLDSPKKDFVVKPGETQIALTGVTVEIPVGYFGWITNKSKNDYLIGGGIVDESYQGELLVKIINTSNTVTLVLTHHFPIAQLLIIPCKVPKVEEVKPEDIHRRESDRKASGGIVNQLITEIREFETDTITDSNYEEEFILHGDMYYEDNFNLNNEIERGLHGRSF